MTIDQETVKRITEEKLGKKLIGFSLKGQGMCNNAWYALAEDHQPYLIKQERPEKEEEEQNDLLAEARIIGKLNKRSPALPIPALVFLAENPKMYGYRYVEGEMMKEVWDSLAVEEKVSLCESLGKFHAELGKALTMEEIRELKITIDQPAALEKEAADDLRTFLADKNLPLRYRQLVKRLYEVFQETQSAACFGLCHNDSHHENILVRQGKLAGVIDFGDADFGDVHREFARYVQDYPRYAEIIVKTYEQLSGNPLCRRRMLALTLLEATDDMRTDYLKNGRIRLIEQLSPWLVEFTTDTAHGNTGQ